MKIKKFGKIFLLIITIALLGYAWHGIADNSPALPKEPIVILYENDAHCTVEGYAKFVAQLNLLEATTPYVSTVSCGDFASGGIVGAIAQGEHIVSIMNSVGYDVVVLGNHELDYGIQQTFKLCDMLDAEVVCTNLINVQTEERPLPAYHILSYGNVDIAYIGFTTSLSGTIAQLSDGQGNRLYSFMRDEFYQNAQYFIDKARDDGADYVVALTHLGDVEKQGNHPNSTELIVQTTGLDAVIDGHDHHTIEERFVPNKEGKQVLLTSTGSAFKNAGVLTLNTQGEFHSALINIKGGNSPVDENTQQVVERIKKEATQSGDYVIGYSEVDLSINDLNGERIVRNQEANIGNLVADAFRVCTGSDVVMINGGGIRADIKKGEITYNDVYNVLPFGDDVYTATLTGQQLLDAVEFSVSHLPKESGEFMQVSGMRFKVDVSIPSPVMRDKADGLYSHVGEDQRRVSDLHILDKQSGEYRPVDPARKYTVASFDYILLRLGGSGILRYAKPSDKYWGQCVDNAINYIQNTLKGHIGTQYAEPDGRIIFK